MAARSGAAWLLCGCALMLLAGAAAGQECAASKTDRVLGMTSFFGNKNTSDSIWHDELPFFRQHGPLTRFTLYKAYFYDGLWHDPGELKGMQFWYGPEAQPPIYAYEDGDANLFGARKPHIPYEFQLREGELITKVELQWDAISMRYASFTTNQRRRLSWGFKNVEGYGTMIAQAPVPGAYVAAIRGFEGRPAKVSKKRYIIQVSVVWAVPSCGDRVATESAVSPAALRVAASGSVYALSDADTVALIPAGIEGATIIRAGVSYRPPAPLPEQPQPQPQLQPGDAGEAPPPETPVAPAQLQRSWFGRRR